MAGQTFGSYSSPFPVPGFVTYGTLFTTSTVLRTRTAYLTTSYDALEGLDPDEYYKVIPLVGKGFSGTISMDKDLTACR
jgi:hypothetical protein